MTEQEALEIARQNGLESEIMDDLTSGMSPEEALEDWDILPDTYDLEEY